MKPVPPKAFAIAGVMAVVIGFFWFFQTLGSGGASGAVSLMIIGTILVAGAVVVAVVRKTLNRR